MTTTASEGLIELTDKLAQMVSDPAIDIRSADPDLLLHCRRTMLQVLDTLTVVQARQPAAFSPTAWKSLKAVDATRRFLWLCGTPQKASEIITGLTARGWRSRPTKTPGATLCADLEHAYRHVERMEDGRWTLTPAAEQVERARAILAAEPLQQEEATGTLLDGWIPQGRGRQPIDHIDSASAARPRVRVLVGKSVNKPRTRSYAGMGILEAARLFSLAARKPLTTRQLIHGMEARGWTTKSRNVTATLYAVLANNKREWHRTATDEWKYVGANPAAG